MAETRWQPFACLSEIEAKDIVLVILNQPLMPQIKLLDLLWKKAVYKACADGAANELHTCTYGNHEAFVPDIITGDFDSAKTEVLQHYRLMGSETEETPDQNETDFTKCLRVVATRTKSLQYESVVVLGSFGGRLDQVFANLETMYHAQTILDKPLYLLSETSLAALLPQGKHRVEVSSVYAGEWCGLIPMGCPCEHVTTSGLKWNLNDQRLKFGELVSTSNTFDGSGHVTIETDQTVLWTMGIKL